MREGCARACLGRWASMWTLITVCSTTELWRRLRAWLRPVHYVPITCLYFYLALSRPGRTHCRSLSALSFCARLEVCVSVCGAEG